MDVMVRLGRHNATENHPSLVWRVSVKLFMVSLTPETLDLILRQIINLYIYFHVLNFKCSDIRKMANVLSYCFPLKRIYQKSLIIDNRCYLKHWSISQYPIYHNTFYNIYFKIIKHEFFLKSFAKRINTNTVKSRYKRCLFSYLIKFFR